MSKLIAIEQAWLEYQQRLLSFIRSKVETAEDAEDILNEVFANLLQKTGKNEFPDNLAAWLYRVTRRQLVVCQLTVILWGVAHNI